MAKKSLTSTRKRLATLQRQFVKAEIDEPTYRKLQALVLEELNRENEGQIEIDPRRLKVNPEKILQLGPSGGKRKGLSTNTSHSAELELKPGSILFDQWEVVRELGRGGFGIVFEVKELHLDQKQAVKILDPLIVSHRKLLERFRQEVSIMRRLTHPRIGRVYDYRENLRHRLAMISMELISGGTVRHLIAASRRRKQQVPLSVTLQILAQIFEALIEVHAHGILHRDISPGNILLEGEVEDLFQPLTSFPAIRLVDFGVAGLISPTELTERSRNLGTLAYIAPEMLSTSEKVTPAVDIYGAGAVAYELITGEVPVGRFIAPADLRQDLPTSMNRFILDLLAREPGQRPSAAVALAKCRSFESLKEWSKGEKSSRDLRPMNREEGESGPMATPGIVGRKRLSGLTWLMWIFTPLFVGGIYLTFESTLPKSQDLPSRPHSGGRSARQKQMEKLPAEVINIEITSNERGADIFLGEDKEPFGQTPLQLLIAPGRYLIRISKRGCEDNLQWIEVKQDSSIFRRDLFCRHYLVRVLSTGDRLEADRTLLQLVTAGFSAVISVIDLGRFKTYQIHVGPFQDTRDAEDIARKIEDEFKLDTLVIAEGGRDD